MNRSRKVARWIAARLGTTSAGVLSGWGLTAAEVQIIEAAVAVLFGVLVDFVLGKMIGGD